MADCQAASAFFEAGLTPGPAPPPPCDRALFKPRFVLENKWVGLQLQQSSKDSGQNHESSASAAPDKCKALAASYDGSELWPMYIPCQVGCKGTTDLDSAVGSDLCTFFLVQCAAPPACAVGCPLGEEDGDVRADIPCPFLQLCICRWLPAQLIGCPQRRCCIGTATSQASSCKMPCNSDAWDFLALPVEAYLTTWARL